MPLNNSKPRPINNENHDYEIEHETPAEDIIRRSQESGAMHVQPVHLSAWRL